MNESCIYIFSKDLALSKREREAFGRAMSVVVFMKISVWLYVMSIHVIHFTKTLALT